MCIRDRKPEPEKITGSVDVNILMMMLQKMEEMNKNTESLKEDMNKNIESLNKNRQEDKEEIKGSIESLKKEISIEYEIVNKRIDDNKIDNDREVEVMAVSYTHL